MHREAERRFGSGEEQHRVRQDYVESLIGDEDDYTDGPAEALWDSYEDFSNTVPTTLAGLFAISDPDEEEAWRSRPYTRRGPNMHTFLFRSRSSILESDEERRILNARKNAALSTKPYESE